MAVRFLYDNEVTATDSTITATTEYSSEYPASNLQDQRLGKLWKSERLSQRVTNGDCESLIAPSLDGVVDAATNGTFSRDAVDPYAGTYSWKFNKDTAAAGGDATQYLHDNSTGTTYLRGLKKGHAYKIDSYLYSTVATPANAYLMVEEYYSASWHTLLTLYPSVASTWENEAGIFYISQASTGIRVKLFIDSGEALNTYIKIDELSVYEVPRIILDVGSGNTISPDAVSMLNHNLGSGAVIKLYGNSSDSWSSPGQTITITWVTENITQIISGNAYRYWCIEIDDSSLIGSYAQFGLWFLGDYLQATKGPTYNLPYPVKSNSIIHKSPTGDLFGSVSSNLYGYSLNFSYWTTAMVQSCITMYEAVGQYIPFILFVDSDDTTTFPVLYCSFMKEPKFTYVFNDFWTAGIEVEECK